MRILTLVTALSPPNKLAKFCLEAAVIEQHPFDEERLLLQAIESIEIPTPEGYEVLATVDCETVGTLTRDGNPVRIENALIRFWFGHADPETEHDRFCCIAGDLRFKHFSAKDLEESGQTLKEMLMQAITSGIETERIERFAEAEKNEKAFIQASKLGTQLGTLQRLMQKAA